MTIKDVAKIAGVSHTTVSRVINNSSNVSPKTRQRILDIIQETGFVPNQAARTMINGKSYELGLMLLYDVSAFPMEFFSTVLEGIVSEIQQYGYTLSVFFKNSKFNKGILNRLDGVFALGIDSKDMHLPDLNIPIISINQRSLNSKISYVIADDEDGAYQMVEYLIRKGHKDIAYLNGAPDFEPSKARKRGYLKALSAHGLAVPAKYEIIGNFDYHQAYCQTKLLLRENPQITAIFSSTDLMALGAIKAGGELGLIIPKDLAVAGFDNQIFSEYTFPTLTTVSKPRRLMGIEAGRKMLRILNNHTHEQGSILPTELIIRNST